MWVPGRLSMLMDINKEVIIHEENTVFNRGIFINLEHVLFWLLVNLSYGDDF